MTPDQLHQRIVTMIDAALENISQLAGVDFTKSISIVWNRRMRSSAGRAFLLENKVELNPRLLHIHEDPEQSLQQVRQTLLHELAHLLTHHRHGIKVSAHGAEWKQACTNLGIPGEAATHQLPLPSRIQRKKWRYICPQCKESIERVKRMKNYSACYSCCKTHNNGKHSKKYQFTEYALSYQ